jgi:hypothetical protein
MMTYFRVIPHDAFPLWGPFTPTEAGWCGLRDLVNGLLARPPELETLLSESECTRCRYPVLPGTVIPQASGGHAWWAGNQTR